MKAVIFLALLALPVSFQPVPAPGLSGLDPEVASQLQDARALVDGLVAQEGSSPAAQEELAGTYGELCRLYHAYALAAAAAPCYANASLLSPRDFRWPYLLGVIDQNEGRLADAEAAYRRALELEPGYVTARIHLGEALLAEGKTAEAEAALKQSLEADPGSAAAHAALGEVFLSRQQYREAVEQLEAALAATPEADRLHHPLGMAYRGLGEMEKARDHLAKAGKVGVRPADPVLDDLGQLRQGATVHLLRGRVAFRFGRYEDAVAEFRKAVAAQPESAPARVNLATALGVSGNRKEAKEQLREALALAPDSATAHFNLGLLLAQEGENAGAVVHLQEAVRIEPDDGVARIELAQVLEKERRLDEALAQYDKGVGLLPQDERGWLGETSVYLQLGRYRDAKERLETAAGNLPTSGLIVHALARFLATCPDLGLRDGAQAVELAQKVYNALPIAVHAETVAMAFAESGRCQEAAKWQKAAIETARKEGPPERIGPMEKTLARYEKGATCRP